MILNAHTSYSLHYGTIKPREMIELALAGGFGEMAMTDINNTSASLEFVRLSKKLGMRPVLGVDFRNGAQQQYVALAKNNDGFQQINGYLSHHIHHKKKFDSRAPELENILVIYPFSHAPEHELLEHEYIGVHTDDLSRLPFSKWLQKPEKLVMKHTVSFRNKRDFNAHRLLRAIDNNTLLSKLAKSEEGRPGDVFISKQELLSRFSDYPFIVENTSKLLAQCTIQFEFGTEQPHKNLRSFTQSIEEDFTLVKQLCKEGLAYRYPNPDEATLKRIDKELKVIHDKSFLSYFLVNWDMCKYARSKGYFYVGRGSGANSIIAYILRITDVDPVELDLYFERFINLYRKNPPDFDIDFSWTDRDDITQYLFNRYENVALIATYSTFQYRAVVRELGKVFGLPKYEIDALSSGKFSMRKIDHLSKLVLQYSALIQELPNHLSVHAGGILISEEPIHAYTATFMPPKGYATTHFDMVVAEDVGLCKFDILSQRGLGKIKDALKIIRYNIPDAPAIDIHDIKRFKEDEKIKSLLRNAKAIGCFYVESPAMRMLLRKLQVDDYLGLVAASSVIRPGVARSGMMREYILRFRYPEKRKEAHPILLDIMPETFGVMVYQEDVIKVAHYFAGLDLGEADILRRGMSGKFRSREEFQKAQQAFFDKSKAKGHEDKLVAEVWRQIESFAGYAFAKGHSASYAVESYQSLFLKAYYPLEYMVATINNFGGFYRTELYAHEARLHGGNVQPPCVNQSSAETTIFGKDIFLGFGLIKQLEHRAIEMILEARLNKKSFESLLDFTKKVAISLDQISILVRIGAFRFTGKNKKELLWEAHLLLGSDKKSKVRPKLLFDPAPRKFELPPLFAAQHEETFDQLELLGFHLNNPFNLLLNDPHGECLASDLPKKAGKIATIIGYLVTVKNTKTNNGKGMYFGTFLDREGQWLDTVHFPPIAQAFPFKGRGIYQITGLITEEFECINVEVQTMVRLAIIEDPRYSEARTTTKRQLDPTMPNRPRGQKARKEIS